MLGRKEKKSQESVSAEDAKVLEITAGMQGALSFQDPVHIKINSTFEGQLDTLGTLVIGENAAVKANIKGESIVIYGEIIGDVTATKSLELKPDARLIGDVKTPSFRTEDGAVLQGKVNMILSEATPRVADLDEDAGIRKDDGSIWFSSEELASYLSVKQSLIYEWADAGKLPGRKDGGSWQFDKKEVDEWVASGMIK